MRVNLHRLCYFFLLIFSCFTALSCYSQPSSERLSVQLGQQPAKAAYQRSQAAYQSQRAIPPKVYDVLRYIRANNRAPQGYVGGRRFGNFEGHLPRRDLSGEAIQYQEWDVNPKVPGRNRGAERLVTGSDGRAWFTRDHYNSFVEVK